MQTSSRCTFCSQYVSTSDQKHQCTEKLYSLINKIIQSNDNNSPALFNNITNLVFQGGGVKGVAYLGALEQLQSEAKKSGRDFLGGVKRIAGTSAGSIVALYLGLNMDVENEIAPLMQEGYERLLDDGLVLKVKLDKSFWGWGLDHKNFKAKHIVVKALKYFDDLNKTLESGNTQLRDEAQKKLQEAVNKVFRYYGEKLGFIPSLAIKIKGSDYASDVVQWLFDLLEPPKKVEPAKLQVQANVSYRYEESVKSSAPGYYSSTYGVGATNYTQYSYPSEYVTSTAYNYTTVKAEPVYSSQGGEVYRRTTAPDSYGTAYAGYTMTSSKKTSSTCFKDIIKGECSGKLSENEKLEIIRAENTTEVTGNSYGVPLSNDLNLRAYNESSTRGYLDNVESSANFARLESNAPINTGYYRNEPQLSFEDGPLARWLRKQALQNPTNPSETNPALTRSSVLSGGYMDNIYGQTSTAYVGTSQPLTYSVAPMTDFIVKSQNVNEPVVKKTVVLSPEPSMRDEKNVIQSKEDDAKEYMERNQRKIIAAAPEAELTWDLLPTALGELLWFIIISQQNAAGVQEQLGVFDGSEVKKELIEKPIIDRLLKLNLVPKRDLTFKELMDYNMMLPDGKKFKQFYVTAFNTETSQTEVFSAEHTPNVVIADAVRASMSIPVFFSPVTIREKDSSGLLQERTYFNGVKRNVVHYMDGGILDNFPLWIFDDFKYCFAEEFKGGPNMKFSIQNPNTLGFRLLDTDTIEKYTNPRFIGKVVTGEEKTKEYKEKFSYQMGLLLNAVANEAQENEHMKRGDYTRSVYVDNKGVSAIAFSLGDDQRESLIESGRQSVRDYQDRANKNFNGEGPIN